LLLGGPDGKTELLSGQVFRQFEARTEPAARKLFKDLAREICELHGLGWRNSYIEGKTTLDIERMHLKLDGKRLELAIDVPPKVWRAFTVRGV
jgi:hypothetical protein